MKKQEDLIYIDRILSGNADAFRFLVEKYKDMVFTIIVKIVGNEADAEELAQDVFLKVYHSLNRFQRKSKFSTWIYRIAYNTAISKTRKKKLTTEMLNDHVLDNYTDDEIHENIYRLSPEQQKKFADKALETLPEEEYLIITLYHKEECSIKEISEIVSLKESNVKVKLHRIRKKLHQKIDALMQEHLITSIVMNNHTDPLKSLLQKHSIQKPSDDFTENIMNLVKTGVILEEDNSPLINSRYLITTFMGFMLIVVASFFIDLSVINSNFFIEFLSNPKFVELFSSYISISDGVSQVLSTLVENKIFVTSIFTISLLVGIDRIFRRKARTNQAFIF